MGDNCSLILYKTVNSLRTGTVSKWFSMLFLVPSTGDIS